MWLSKCGGSVLNVFNQYKPSHFRTPLVSTEMLIPTFHRNLWKYGSRLKIRKSLDAPSEMFLLTTAVNLDERKANIFNPRCFFISKDHWITDFYSFSIFLCIVVEIKDRMQYCMEEPKRGCWHPYFQHRYTIGTRPERGASRRTGGRYEDELTGKVRMRLRGNRCQRLSELEC